MLFRMDPCGIACIMLTYAAVLYADYVVVYWLLYPNVIYSFWGIFHTVAFNMLMLLLTIAHIRAMVSDPGIVPLPRTQMDFSDIRGGRGNGSKSLRPPSNGQHQNQQQQQQQQQSSYVTSEEDSESDASKTSFVGEDWTVCGRCEAYRPPRAHHCRICKRCVRKMDHHCPWINNCVGEYNQKYFMQFLFYVGCTAVYCLALVLSSWLTACVNCMDEKTKHIKVLHTIFVTIEASLFCLFVVAVSCDQFQSIFNDETAVEQVQRRGPYRAGKSKRALLKEVCGSGPIILWLLPCHNLPRKRDYLHMPAHYPV